MTAQIETETWIDKSTWGGGAWQNEPDRVEWRDEATGLPCLMIRHHSYGNWCGYVGLPPGHHLHGVHCDEVPELVTVAAHVGLTFTGPCMEDGRPRRMRVCHVPLPGESDAVWWLGFDCARYCDLMPGMVARDRELGIPTPLGLWDGMVYRDQPYVMERCGLLAAAACEGVGVEPGE